MTDIQLIVYLEIAALQLRLKGHNKAATEVTKVAEDLRAKILN